MAAVLEPGQDTTHLTLPPPPAFAGVDHIEWWVGNARTTAGFWASHFGFTIAAYAGPETGFMDRASYLLTQGDLRFVITGGLGPDSQVGAHQLLHGDGVRDIALSVANAGVAFDRAVARGATPVSAPHTVRDDRGTIVTASVMAYGQTLHTFVERHGPDDWFAPGFEAAHDLVDPVGPTVGIVGVDHVVGNVERGTLDGWVTHYARTFGFDQLVHFDDSQISTDYTSLQSTVVWDRDRVVMPINEPADGLKKSQIEEYLDAYRGAGVQHIAMRTDDIVATVTALRARGIRFMTVPDSYYDEARRRLAGVDLPWEDLQRLGILVDRDDHGHLLQIFTETVTDRPTVFCEIIQREGCTGFGVGNFKALFESIEREQARRGNL